MNLQLNNQLSSNYSSNSQIARVLTESWVHKNSYCPNCSCNELTPFKNNNKAGDFFCNDCSEEYELKSKDGNSLGDKIVDGAYSSMIERITSLNNPNFFFLNYNKKNLTINNFLIVPKHFFVPEIIEKRKPLSDKAKRAGWIGCNIEISKIPENGRIFIVKNSEIIAKQKVKEKWQSTSFLKSKTLDTRGWILDIMKCVDRINNDEFSLKEIYSFENELKIKYPNNNFIKDKIRQQLQLLRDKGIIEFSARGIYKKVIF